MIRLQPEPILTVPCCAGPLCGIKASKQNKHIMYNFMEKIYKIIQHYILELGSSFFLVLSGLFCWPISFHIQCDILAQVVSDRVSVTPSRFLFLHRL